MIKKKPKIEVFYQICELNFCNVRDIARAFNVTRKTIYQWLQKPAYKEAFENARESSLDFCENQMFVLIKGIPTLDKEGNIIKWAEKPSEKLIQFYLETRGKDRGYIKQQDVNHSGEVGFNFFLVMPDKYDNNRED